MEEWRDIEGYPDYKISDDGRVMSMNTYRNTKPRILSPGTSAGYLIVCLRANKVGRMHRVHKLVADAFLPPMPQPGMDVNHKDSNRGNPRVDNLEWMTRKENLNHGAAAGNHNRGERNGSAKLTNRQVQEVIDLRVAGVPCRELAAIYGVGARSVRRIISGDRQKYAIRPDKSEIPVITRWTYRER